jgi:SAM-dependent methyltransferase
VEAAHARGGEVTRVGQDGLPLPPQEMIVATVGGRRQSHDDLVRGFFRGGVRTVELMRDSLARHGHAFESCDAILDFGCGCGRVIRHLRGLGPALYGCDRKREVVAWCETNLPFASFSVNDVTPGLAYDSGAFSLVYALSVFTHLTAELQTAWTAELARVLAPGGIMLVTLHGGSRIRRLDAEAQAAFHRGQLVVGGSDPGSNRFAAFHPEEYVMNEFARGFDVLEYVPGGMPTMKQDLLLLRKPR